MNKYLNISFLIFATALPILGQNFEGDVSFGEISFQIKEFHLGGDYLDKDFEMSNLMYDSGICLPTFLQITEEEIEYVCNIIKKVTK